MRYSIAVVPGYYLVCYNNRKIYSHIKYAVVPGYYLVCYNDGEVNKIHSIAVVPGYYLVCYNLKIVMNLMAQL